MQQPNQQPKPRRTIHEATYAMVRRLTQQLEPLSKLVQDTDALDQPEPMDTMIELLRQSVEGIEKLHTRLENLESRLDEPMVAKALKDAVNG